MVTVNSNRASTCVYRLLESGIHEIAFDDVSRETLDELFVYLNRIFDNKTHNDPRLMVLLTGVASGFPSLHQLMANGKDMVGRHPDRPQISYALILQGNVRHIIPAFERLIRLFRGSNRVRSFGPEQRAAAEAWLLSERDST